MRQFAILLAATIALVAPAAADQILPAPRVLPNGDLLYQGRPKLGTFTGTKYISKPDTLQLQGTGSTGDVSGMSAPANALASFGTLARMAHNLYVGGNGVLLEPYITNRNCTVDQTANINGLLAGISGQNKVIFPTGCILISGTLVNNGQVWEGAGWSYTRSGADEAYTGGTHLRFNGPSGVAVKMLGSGARLTGIALSNIDSGSTAVGIQMGDSTTQPHSQVLDHVHLHGFSTQIDVQSGQYWHIRQFDLHNAALYGIRVRNLVHSDAGDGNLTGGTIYADSPIGNSGAAVRIESGGGLKFKGVKTLQFGRSVDLQVADGAGTSDLFMDASNSFENATSGYCVRLGRSGTTGIWHNIHFSAQCVGGVEVYNGVTRVQLGGNVAYAPIGYKISGGDNVNVVDGAVVFGPGTAAVAIQDPATNVRVGKVNCTSQNPSTLAPLPCPAEVLDERTTGAGLVAREDVRPINLAQSATYTALWQIDMPVYRGARVKVQVEGTLASKGAVNSIADYTLTRNTGNVVVGTATSAVTAGFGVDVQFDTTTTPGAVIVGVRPNSAVGGGALTGSVTISVDGKSAYFKKL